MKKSVFISLMVLTILITASCTNQDNYDSVKKTDKLERAFTREEALEIEDEFMSRLFPEREEDGLVKDFQTKEELLKSLSVVSEPEIANIYVSTYYEERDGKLYIRATEGPLNILKDEPFALEKLNDTQYQLIQESVNTLRGRYRFIIKYIKRGDNWVIKDRVYESR